MEITPVDSSLFRASIEALKDFLPQAQMHVSEKGIVICGMDASHVGFIDYCLSSEDCSTLKVDAPHTLGIQTSILSRVLTSVSAGDRMTLCLNASRDKLVISYANDRISKKALYEVPLMDIDEEHMALPALTYSATVKAKTSDVCHVMKEVGHFGDTLLLRLDEDGFHISASGDCGSVKQTLENTEDRDMELTEDSVEASFSTKYMNQIMKGGATLSPSMNLEFDPSQPLRASFQFGQASHFVAYLAPKIVE